MSKTRKPSAASRFVMRPCRSGRTGSGRHLPPKSVANGSKGCVLPRVGAGISMRFWSRSTASPRPMAGRRPRRGSASILCHHGLGQGGGYERSRGPRKAGEGAAIEQDGREFTPTLPTTRASHAPFPADENPSEIRLGTRLGSQSL